MQDELKQRWKQQFLKLEADGVDFISTIPINYDNPTSNQIAESFTKQEFLALKDYSYPRLPHVFWKKIFGQKCYITNSERK